MFDRIQKGLWWDKTLSLVSGCTPVSESCNNCWLAQETAMRGVQTNEKIKARYGGLVSDGKFTGVVREMWGDLEKVTPKQTPAVWSVWSDLFHESVSNKFRHIALERMRSCDQHLFLVCTKRIRRAEIFSGMYLFPENLMIMTTVENQEAANERIPALLRTDCKWRGLSIEPLLGPVDLALSKALSVYKEAESIRVVQHCNGEDISYNRKGRGYVKYNTIKPLVDWVIVGCESGKNARPMNLDWVRLIRDQCIAAGVPFFFKQAMIDGKLVKAPFLDGQLWLQTPEVNKGN